MNAHLTDAPLVVTTWTGHELRVATMAEAYAAAAIPQPHAIVLPNPPVHGWPIYLFDRRVLEPSAAAPPTFGVEPSSAHPPSTARAAPEGAVCGARSAAFES